MKRKFLLPILSVCMVVALVSVGFAAWLITGNDTQNTTGSFVTYDVTNNYFTVTAAPADENAEKITFGHDDSTQSGWLTVDGVDTQDLSATFTITITPDVAFAGDRDVAAVLGTGKVVKITLNGTSEDAEPVTTTQTKFQEALTANYLAQPAMSCTYNEGETEKTADSGSTTWADGVVIELPAAAFTIATDEANKNKFATATVTVTFAWGSAFTPDDENQNPVNPYTYFNGLSNTSGNRLAATTALETLNGLNAATYYLHLAVVPASTPAA